MFCFVLETDKMLTWETLENVDSGHDLYFDLFGWAGVGQILQSFAAAIGILVQAACSCYGP